MTVLSKRAGTYLTHVNLTGNSLATFAAWPLLQ